MWELGKVPFHWRSKARTVNAAKKDVLVELSKKGVNVVYVADL